ncbi:MAG: 6-hydroxymethylpterin diphosphokinase MptE-like protein, partial [Promethearchaeota archaeon]
KNVMNSSLKEQIDYYIEFKEWYSKIKEDFKFKYLDDCKARDFLAQILKKKKDEWNLEKILKSFKAEIQSKANILIFGCGPSLEKTIENIIKRWGLKFFNNFINLAADGAAVLLREKSIPINGIFTDLDGITKKEFNKSDYIIIHAHGNNIKKLKLFEKEILNFKNIIGTTQVEPIGTLLNPGGFTDGDRILYFLRSLLLPKHKLFLIGMDFKKIIGKYSKPEMTEDQKGSPIKIKKLRYAIYLIEWFTSKIKNRIYIVNSKTISEKFVYISIEEFKKIIDE